MHGPGLPPARRGPRCTGHGAGSFSVRAEQVARSGRASGQRRAAVPDRGRRVVIVVVALACRLPGARSHRIATERGRPAAWPGREPASVPLSVSQAGIAADDRRCRQQPGTCPAGRSRSPTPRRCRSRSSANLPTATGDSVGVFQQRPSRGLGHQAADREPGLRDQPVLRRAGRGAALPADADLRRRPRPSSTAPTAPPTASTRASGTALALAFTGTEPHAVWCTYGAPVGRPRLAAARTALTAAFGRLRGRLTRRSGGSVRVTSERQGWAVAGWLVSHAASYGISHVRYRGYEWLRQRARALGQSSAGAPDAGCHARYSFG